MKKIANPQDLQDELRRLVAYCESDQPSRERLASDLNDLASRVALGPRNPRSIYDRLPARFRPFTWATPARVAPGYTPEPWRVPHVDNALAWMKHLFPVVDRELKIWTDFNEDWRGRKTIAVGVRDNRDREKYYETMMAMARGLEKFAETRVKQVGDRVSVFLVDDLVSEE